MKVSIFAVIVMGITASTFTTNAKRVQPKAFDATYYYMCNNTWAQRQVPVKKPISVTSQHN